MLVLVHAALELFCVAAEEEFEMAARGHRRVATTGNWKNGWRAKSAS